MDTNHTNYQVCYTYFTNSKNKFMRNWRSRRVNALRDMVLALATV